MTRRREVEIFDRAAGARSAIEYLYFTSARHLVSEHARANVMRGMIAHVTRLHGEQAFPAFVRARTGLVAAPDRVRDLRRPDAEKSHPGICVAFKY